MTLKKKLYLFRQDYDASGGREIFLSLENKDRTKLYSLLRLRLCNGSDPLHPAIIREVHTYGQLQPIEGSRTSFNSPQHRGLGKKLIKEAEKIVKKESASRRIAVISGIGVRGYWRSLGYKLQDTYMIRMIRRL